MRVLVTRPLAQAAEWVERLQAHRIDAVALPLIEIGPPPDPAAVNAAWSTLAARQLVVFVSPNAVDAFFDAAPPGPSWPAQVRAASPGPGTSAALAARGVPAALVVEPAADAPQFDSEALWARLAGDDWESASVLAVRGTGGRDFLGARLRERGATVDVLSSYTRGAPGVDGATDRLLREAIADPRRHLWLFSSSEAIGHLVARVAGGGLAPAEPWRDAAAVATHPRIAQRAREAGFARVTPCRPALASVVACIQSMRS